MYIVTWSGSYAEPAYNVVCLGTRVRVALVCVAYILARAASRVMPDYTRSLRVYRELRFQLFLLHPKENLLWNIDKFLSYFMFGS